MKKAILALSLLFSISSFADDCVIKSKYEELESGLNKDQICEATLFVLTGQYSFSGQELLIEANGERGKNTVELTKIEMSVEGNEVYQGSGILNWEIHDLYVILSE